MTANITESANQRKCTHCISIKMALKVWPVGVFVVFVMMWLCRRRAAHQRERMVEGLAAKVRLLRKSGVVNEVIQDHGCYVV